jgi:branched-chain amino acid transport system substrate-binding protein
MIQQEEVDFLVGPVASSSADAMLSVASRFEGEFVWLSPSAGSTALTEACNKSFIRTSWNNWQLGKPFGQWVHENVGESAYVLATDYAAGDQIGGYFEEGFEEAGGTIEGVARPPLGNTDWSSFMQNARNSGADVLFSFTSGTDEVGLVKSFSDLGLRDAGMSLTASATIATQDNLEAYGEAGIGTKGIATYSPSKESEENIAFREAHLETYDYLPQFWGANAYDAATVLAVGVTEGGITPEEFIPTVEGYKWESPRGTMAISEKSHDPIFDLTVDEVVALEGEPSAIQPHGSGVTSTAIDVLEEVEAPTFGCDHTQ